MTSIPAGHKTETQQAETLEDRFQRLADAWERAVAHHSSDRVRYGDPAYQEIIGLGPSVVPLLLRDLEVSGRHWFAALRALTGAHPVATEDAGNIPRMAEAWLRWGRENGYRW
jgi:hypothetical protein